MKKYIVIIVIIIIFLLTVFTISYNKSNDKFITDNDTKLNTEIVSSYTVKDGDKSYEFTEDTTQFYEINYILENAELYHDKSRLYLYDESPQIILNDKFIMYVYTGDLSIDNSATLIVKDYCKGKSTNYLLDNHDYLIAKLTKEEYSIIFSNN